MKNMKAVVLNEVKNFDSMRVEKVSYPYPKSGEVVVQIKASALNHRDVWIVQGLYARIKVPVILGSDGAGVVTEIGEKVDPDWLNKEVIINPGLDWGPDPQVQQSGYRILGMPDNGTQAEYVAEPISNIIKKPFYLSFEEAASIPLAGLTGYRALFTQGHLKAGETVLLTGIGGGVASLMLQMSLAAGAEVLVTSGSDEKINKAMELGATGGANYNYPNWPEKIQTLLGNHQINLIVDSAGGKGFADLINLIKPAGKIVFFGATDGNPSEINLRKLFWNQITLKGTTMGNEKDFAEMIELFESKNITPIVDKVYSSEHYRDAYERMMKGEQFGKIVLTV